jgi:hypothetical protein
MITPILLVVLAAPIPPVPIELVIIGQVAPYFNLEFPPANVLQALAPAGLEALPSCQRAWAQVDSLHGCTGESTMYYDLYRVCAKASVSVGGANASACAYELVSAPWPRAIVYDADGFAAALVWRESLDEPQPAGAAGGGASAAAAGGSSAH